MAMLNRRFMPPENFLTCSVARLDSPTISSSASERLLHLLLAAAVDPADQGKVLSGAEALGDGGLLGRHPDGLLDRERIPLGVVAHDRRRTAAGLEQATEHLDGGRLAGAVGSQ